MTYDRIGNISTLTRGELISGNLAQNLYAYTYLSTNNRLQSVTKNGAADRSVGYDSNGNMLTDSKIGITASTLGRANLPYAVTKSGTSINYLYSGDDNRIYKAVSTTQKEWYIRTGGGVDLGVFDISNNKYTWYVFGAERVAKINHVPTLTITEAAGNTGGNLYTSDPFVIPLNVGSNLPAPIADYYAYDHLGNTRLVYGALIGCASSVPNYQLRYAGDYYPFGKVLREWSATTAEKFLYTQKERDKETGLDYFGARYYDSELGRFLGVDPLAQERVSLTPYNFCSNNPINRIDPTGALDDFVQDADGNIKWDNNANSQATTKAGETYLGKTLEFKFNSYIDGKLWDGPMGNLPAGDKLTSTISVTGNENSKGELTSISATKSVSVGETPVGTARSYYPGLGDGQNKFSLTTTSSGVNLNFEQHASVSSSEQFGMRLMGYNIVNVAQKLDINYSQGKLSVSSATDVFPSATLTMNGATMMQYNQPSFKATHSFPIKGWTNPSPYKDNLGPQPIYDYSYKPAMWYKR